MKIHLPLSLAKALLLVGMAQMTPTILAESVSSSLITSTEERKTLFKYEIDLDLGTLNPDNSGPSYAYAVSEDGSAIVGQSYSDGSSSYRAFVYKNGVMTDLGTLKDDDSGSSTATSVSADGSVIVWQSDIDEGGFHAFVYKNDVMIDLGTLKADDSGVSYANAVSADGSVIVGNSMTDESMLLCIKMMS